jgi:hypothetical protein
VQREVFTIWMKSLVLNGSGCTVFDSSGRIVYRVDNYGPRHSVDVCLMDITESVVLQVLKRFWRWDGYRRGNWESKEPDAPRARGRPWFTVVSKRWGHGPSCEFRTDGGRAVQVRVGDDGCGIDPGAPPGRGLRGMQERVRALGGSFAIAGAAGGTRIEIAIPIKPADGAPS